MSDAMPPRSSTLLGTTREPAGAFDMWETARRIGHLMWVEVRLFEVLGGWAEAVPELEAKLQLGAQAPHHAWHAELLQGLLPTAHEIRPEQFVLPPNDELVAFVDALASPTGTEFTVEKLTGVYRVVLPHQIAAHTFHLNCASTVTVAPAARALRFILTDELDDWRTGEMLLQSLTDSPELIDRALTQQARLQKLLLASGGIAGPGTLTAAGPATNMHAS
jgi:hypothetical protein